MLTGAYHQAGRHQEALEVALELVDLDRDWDGGYACIARSYLALGQLQRTIEYVEAMQPPSAACLSLLALARHYRGDFAAELETARRGLRRFPEHPVFGEAEGAALAALGREDELRRLFLARLAAADPATAGTAPLDLHGIVDELEVHGRGELSAELARHLLDWYDRRGAVEDFQGTLFDFHARLAAGERRQAGRRMSAWLAAAGDDFYQPGSYSRYWVQGLRGWAAALAGRPTAARRSLARLRHLEPLSESYPMDALILAELGETEAAVRALLVRLESGMVLTRDIHDHPSLISLYRDPDVRRWLSRHLDGDPGAYLGTTASVAGSSPRPAGAPTAEGPPPGPAG